MKKIEERRDEQMIEFGQASAVTKGETMVTFQPDGLSGWVRPGTEISDD